MKKTPNTHITMAINNHIMCAPSYARRVEKQKTTRNGLKLYLKSGITTTTMKGRDEGRREICLYIFGGIVHLFIASIIFILKLSVICVRSVKGFSWILFIRASRVIMMNSVFGGGGAGAINRCGSSSGIYGTLDLLNGRDKRRGNDTFDDIQEWLNTIARKTEKTIEKKHHKTRQIRQHQKEILLQQEQQQQNQEISHDETTGFGGSETINSNQSPNGSNNVKTMTKKTKKIRQNLENENKVKLKLKGKIEEEILPVYFEPEIDCRLERKRVKTTK